jgi:hypothetical protein
VLGDETVVNAATPPTAELAVVGVAVDGYSVGAPMDPGLLAIECALGIGSRRDSTMSETAANFTRSCSSVIAIHFLPNARVDVGLPCSRGIGRTGELEDASVCAVAVVAARYAATGRATAAAAVVARDETTGRAAAVITAAVVATDEAATGRAAVGLDACDADRGGDAASGRLAVAAVSDSDCGNEVEDDVVDVTIAAADGFGDSLVMV